MQEIPSEPGLRPTNSPLKRRILISIGLSILLSLLGTGLALYRLTDVQSTLSDINRTAVPLGRLMTQLRADADLLQREMERRLGETHWNDPHWRAQPFPEWLEEVIVGEITQIEEIAKSEPWRLWTSQVRTQFKNVQTRSQELFLALQKQSNLFPHQIYPEWKKSLIGLTRELNWGLQESDRLLRENFQQAGSQVADLKTGLRILLASVLALSFVLLWLGDRALKPLSDLTKLAQSITRRGLRKEDKSVLPEIPLHRNDEVSGLAREFHRMATTLLEREKTVEAQTTRLEEQNQQLREHIRVRMEMEKKLRHAEHLAAVGRLSAQVAHEVRNPLHSIGLEAEMAAEMAQGLAASSTQPKLKQSIQSILEAVDRLDKITENYLKLSRLSSGQKAEVDLGSLLETVLASYAPIAEKQGVKVDWSREAGAVLTTFADASLLEQVFGNLMRNALQALEETAATATRSPVINWRLGASESGRIWVRIEDNGPGILPSVREKIFEPYVTTKAQGTGLGLPFIKQVLDDHGAEIRYVDVSGGGACFEMIFNPKNSAMRPS